ncbi:LOW QUALITY PROTEIN: uncharacterized protein C10orf67 homolog, mitochondrial [Leptosomus discolor]
MPGAWPVRVLLLSAEIPPAFTATGSEGRSRSVCATPGVVDGTPFHGASDNETGHVLNFAVDNAPGAIIWPCISGDLNIGYYSTDHAMQTDIKQLLELKELTIATQALTNLIHSLQQDLFIYKSIIQAQYEEKIEEQASNLCKYINDPLTDIKFLHKWVVFEDDDHEKNKLEKDNEDFKEDVFKLHNEISRLQNALKHSEKENKQIQRMRSKMEADGHSVQKIMYVVPEQQAAERTLTAETEKLKKHKGKERQTTERKEAEQSNTIWKKKLQILQNSLHAIKDEVFLRKKLQHQLLAHKCTSLHETVPLKEDIGYSEGILDIFNDSSALRRLFLTADKLCVEHSVVANLSHPSMSE